MALLLALLSLVAVVDQASAAEVPTLTGFTVSSWSGDDGATLGAVRAIAQDRDGYLWLGTDSGLYRFDGVHFVQTDVLATPALPKRPVRALLMDNQHRLWVGLGDGGGVYRLAGHRLESVNLPIELSGNVNALAESLDGVVWVAHDNGLLRMRGEVWTSVGDSDGLTANRAYHVRAEGNTLFVGTPSGLFVRQPTGRFVRDASAGDDLVRFSAADSSGRLWVTNPTTGLRQAGRNAQPAPSLAGRGWHLLRDRDGDLWLATVGQGLWKVGRNGIKGRLTLQNGLLSDGIWSLLEDREGNVWIGTHEGLNRLTRHLVTPLVDLGITSSIAAGADNLIWATSSDGLIRFTVTAEGSPTRTIFPRQSLRTLHANAFGDIWTASRDGLYRFAGGAFEEVRTPAGASFSQVTAITSALSRTVWFADTSLGLWRWEAGQLSLIPRTELLTRGRINLMRTGPDGTVWMASESGGLTALRPDGSSELYGVAEGLQHETILGLWDDPMTGLWVAGSGGLSHLSGRHFVTIDRRHGLPAARITAVLGDALGGLWLAYSNGVARLDPKEVERVTTEPGTRLRLRIIGTSEGLAGVPTTLDTNTATRGADGKLWFVTGRGVTIIDPTGALARPAASGPVLVEAAMVDDVLLPVGTRALLPSGSNRVRIDYTALNLTAPDRLRFRYQLEGFDQTWQDAGPRRQAFYTNLEPRSYRFRVQAGADDGTWQDATASWAFSVAPMFYQRPAFYILCALGLTAVLGAAWRVRLRNVRNEFRLVLAERARLSRELHDTLLQSMVGIALKVDAIAKVSDLATSQLIDVRRDIEDSITEARRTIRNIRSGQSPAGPADLITALEDAGARATAGTSTRFRIIVAGAPYRCEADVEQELLRIAQEALANAVRHGHPSQVLISVNFEQTAVALRVSDNGHGFKETESPPSHFGLQTMRERAEHLGGHFSLTTSKLGTEVLATIPISSFG